MAYTIEFLPRARRDLAALPRAMHKRVGLAIDALAHDPRPAYVKKLHGHHNTWRVRVGDYRVLYEIHDMRLLVLVLRIGDRKDIYR